MQTNEQTTKTRPSIIVKYLPSRLPFASSKIVWAYCITAWEPLNCWTKLTPRNVIRAL